MFLKKIFFLSGLFLLLAFGLPNLFNEREEKAFSDEFRIAAARQLSAQPGDSVAVVPGAFYDRSKFFQLFLGSNYRDLWQKEVKVPVLDLEQVHGGLSPVEFSGGQQTIGIEAEDSLGHVWSIRSVNKDQANALAGFLKPTFLRPMFRDQTSSLNPYAAKVTAKLAAAADIHHTDPELYYFPYDEDFGKYNQRMAGRLVLLNQEVDEGWAGAPSFGSPAAIIDTDEMLKKRESQNIPVDSILYLRSRLLDLLVSDWDRHEGNWKWILRKKGSEEIFEPFPVDRDMAFYKFGNGVINDVVLLFLKKFQSFTPNYKSIKGLMHQSKKLDMDFLKNLPKKEFIEQAKLIQRKLKPGIVKDAFKEYPAAIYEAVGTKHQEILQHRLEKLPSAAEEFYQLVQKE